MHIARLIIFIGLLVSLVSSGLVGCGIGDPPVQSLEQWQREYYRVKSRNGE
jgi:hypothetical protein